MAISLGEYRVSLDSKDDAANVSFVSHAHTDHISGLRKNKKAFASGATKELVEGRSGIKMELLEEPDCIDLLNAGHILGSRQLYVQNDLYGYNLIYSGDYQVSEPIAGEKIETRRADVLIIDSTYPDPRIKFEERNGVVTAIQHYAKMKLERGSVLFGARIVGRAQELIKILNEFGMTPVVDEKIARMNDIYERHGISLKYLESRFNGDTPKENFVGIVEQSKLGALREEISSKNSRRVFTAIASGLAKMFRFDTDVQFALSDHADFSQALEYINACDPKIVFTFGSNAKIFARNLAMRGYDARPLYHTSEVNGLMLNYI